MYSVGSLFQNLIIQPYRRFEVRALVNGVEYGADSIVEFTIDEAITESDDFSIGNAIPARLDISFRTTDKFPVNSEIRPFLRLKGSTADTEWLPLGFFYIDSRKFENDVWKFTCYDKLMQANQPWKTNLMLPAPMRDVIDEICEQLNITLCPDTVIKHYEVPLMTHDFTMRQVIGYIAACHAANARINKDGELCFIKCRKFSQSGVF
mgnify:FL=1